MKKEILRGDVFRADLSPVRGSEQGGARPVLVIQNNLGNLHSPTVIIAPITSKLKKNKLPTHVSLPSGNGLPARSMVLLEQIRTIDKGRLLEYITALDDAVMREVNYAVEISLDLQSEEHDERPEEIRMCLCPTCALQFYKSPVHMIRRVNPLQKARETCSCCGVRKGYDYRIQKRSSTPEAKSQSEGAEKHVIPGDV